MRGKNTTKVEHLGNVPLFAELTRKELDQLAKLCDEAQVAEGKVLVKQGSVGFECFVIEQGQVKVERDGVVLATLGPGAYFGELALLDKQPRSATVTALTDLLVVVLGPREFASALDTMPGLARKIMTVLARRLRDMDARFVGH